MQYVSEANAEVHYMLLGMMFRPIELPPDDALQSQEKRYIEAFKSLCTSGPGEAQWPAVAVNPGDKGPFQRGWEQFAAGLRPKAESFMQKCLNRKEVPSLWLTREAQYELRSIAKDAGQLPHEANIDLGGLCNMEEYCAFKTLQLAANFQGTARARSQKQRRQVDADVKVAEDVVLYTEGGGGCDDECANDAVADARTKAGLASFKQSTVISHRFTDAELDQIVAFKTADRTQQFVKSLLSSALMSDGEFPLPIDVAATRRRTAAARDLSERFGGLESLGDELKHLVSVQRSFAGKVGMTEQLAPGDVEHLPADDEAGLAHLSDADPVAGDPRSQASNHTPVARFAPNDQWRRPHDYVAHLAAKFEEGIVDATTGSKMPRPLKRDQVLFIAQFAAACDAVWDDEANGVAMKDRRTFNILLMGQGGSGKTAVVQEIVLPAVDFLFPPNEPGAAASTLIVCAKWSQAENISTDNHKAVSCHRAALMGIGNHRNSTMLPNERKGALERTWAHLRLLVIEEVSMVSPNLYNMLLYRSFYGRRERWAVSESEYDRLSGAFGRMPITIHLGDFLQLKPTGAGLSLITKLDDLETLGQRQVPAEQQSAMTLFKRTPLCFELVASNRFKDDRLRDLMVFMRKPLSTVPKKIKDSWNHILLKDGDKRLKEERFQNGHLLGIYWDTVARCMMMRAMRDAKAAQEALYLIQAADASKPSPMRQDLAVKLANKVNPGDTGNMHGILPIHVGMRVRLLDHIDLEKGLVKDAEGVVVRVEINPADVEEVDCARHEGRPAYLRFLPSGIWVSMCKYKGAAFVDRLRRSASCITEDDAASLVFVEPRTADPFDFRGHSVVRTGFPLSHGCVVTSTACQGRTMRRGVIIDAGKREGGQNPTRDDDYWLHMYVMLSRATHLDDILLARAPDIDFLRQGPPESLARALGMFAKRADGCRKKAEKLAAELGLVHLLRGGSA